MNILKGNIEKTFNAIGRIKTSQSLNGKIKSVYEIYGSVTNFIRSLVIRIIISPKSNILSKFSVNKNLKTNINLMSNLVTKFYGIKHITGMDINSIANVNVNIRIFRNMKISIQGQPIFGKNTNIGLIDGLILDDLDLLSLGELEFTEGVTMNVVKQAKSNIFGIAEVSSTLYVLRYTKLNDIDDLTLDNLDTMTLESIEETII